MSLKHQFDLRKQGKKHTCPGGSRVLLSSDTMKTLHGMALASLVLKKGGVREPHWHPNASELAYCIEGRALVTMFSPRNTLDTFTLEKGEVAYFPRGYIHHIENIALSESKFLLAYDHDSPEDFDLTASVASMPVHVLASTFNGGEALFQKIKKRRKDTFISLKKRIAKLPPSGPNPNKFNLERINPQIDTSGGYAKIANMDSFPKLEHLALFSLRVYKNGIREPHWHPNSTELNYVIQGKARVTILSPGGKPEVCDLHPGQGSMIPAGYFHAIENLGEEELFMTIFFNNPNPDDIGLSGALSSYSKETLASIFSVEPKFFGKLAHYTEDRMIVSGR